MTFDNQEARETENPASQHEENRPAGDGVEITTGDINVEKGGILNIAGGNIIQNVYRFFQGDIEQQRVFRNRQNMLSLVYSTWVEGFLDKSLHNDAFIKLELQTQPEFISHPWEMLVQMPDQETRQVPPGTTILDLFDASNGSLLILGEPGSGKTSMLLEMCAGAIERAKADPLQPIPVVFNLSSWTPTRSGHPEKSLANWLLVELKTKYAVPTKIAIGWIESDALLLLLDGLDEVSDDHRASCIEAINTFRTEHAMPMVVCSRLQEYASLEIRLGFASAVRIQPLTPDQLENYLRSLGELGQMILPVWQRDSALSQLVKTPLILNILVMMAQQVSMEELAEMLKREDFLSRLLDTYIAQMFVRRGASSPFMPDEVTAWLAWLAKTMLEKSRTVFALEDIQPSWLLMSALWHRVLFGLVFGVLGGLMLGLVGAAAQMPGISVAGFVIFGVYGFRGDAAPTDHFSWSWVELRKGLLVGILGGLIAGPIVINIFGLLPGQVHWLSDGIRFGLLVGVPFGFFVGFRGASIQERKLPGDGVRASIRNVGLLWGFFGILGVALAGLWARTWTAAAMGGFYGVMIGIIFALINGEEFLLKYWLSRGILTARYMMPRDIVLFLEYAADRAFLRQVGSGYIFIHRVLQEHFAARWEA